MNRVTEDPAKIKESLLADQRDAARYRWLKAHYDLAVGETEQSMPIDDDLIDDALSGDDQ